MKRNIVSLDRLKERVTYDAESGHLVWNECNGIHKDFNEKLAGKRVGSINKDGYINLTLDFESYLEHRLIWYYHTGEYPKGQIDHRDGDKLNNRIENLRVSTPIENSQNKTFKQVRRNGGLRGAYYRKRENKWCSKIKHDGKLIWIGYYDDEKSASEAYERKAKELRGEYYMPPT